MRDQKPVCSTVINVFCQLCAIFHLEWDLTEGRKYVPMKCLTCFFVLRYRSIPHFSGGNFPLVSNPIFPKLPASAAAPASAPLKAQCPIKLSYPCGKESFLSLPHSFTHSIHHWYHFPPFSITFLFLHYPALLEKRTCLNTIRNTN